MLTGDNEITARAMAGELGIDGVLPEDKHDAMHRLQSEGTGAEVAVESAGITPVLAEPTVLATARRLGRARVRNMRKAFSSPSSTMAWECLLLRASSTPLTGFCSRRSQRWP